jgi:ribonuclease III
MSLFQRIFFPHHLHDRKLARALKSITTVTPNNLDIYELALRHSSFNQKSTKEDVDNQRLEFLGDAILGAVVAEYLYKKFPEKDEGFLTNLRSKIVSRKSLNRVAVDLGIHRILKKKLDKNKPAHSIYGDAFEALVGALYLDRGIGRARCFIINKVVKEYWDDNKLEDHIISYKSALIEWAQKEKIDYSFNVIDEWGQKHALNFEVGIFFNKKQVASGKGTSKKRAEETAAKIAYHQLNIS